MDMAGYAKEIRADSDGQVQAGNALVREQGNHTVGEAGVVGLITLTSDSCRFAVSPSLGGKSPLYEGQWGCYGYPTTHCQRYHSSIAVASSSPVLLGSVLAACFCLNGARLS
jgi:hypothetical protein